LTRILLAFATLLAFAGLEAGGASAGPLLAAGEIVTPVAPDNSGKGAIVTPVEPGAAAAVKIRPAAPGQVVYLTHNLKLREAPGLKGRVLGVLKPSMAMTVKGQTYDKIDGYRWLQVEGRGMAGFIANLDLTKSPPKRRGTAT